MNDKQWIPIHEDKELTEAWWSQRGFEIGTNLFYNSIRDGSGRYEGFCLVIPHGDSVCAQTVREAKIAIKWYLSQQVLYTIRTAGHNMTNWAEWAQKWAAHAMRPTVFPAPPHNPPEEPRLTDDGPEWLPVADAPKDGTWFWNLFSLTTVGAGKPATVQYVIQKVQRRFSGLNSPGYWSNGDRSIPDHSLSGVILLIEKEEP